METSAHAKLAALVAAWHNRHPLARRITPAQVRGEGVVALPFLARHATRDEPTLAEAPSVSATTEAAADSSATGVNDAPADAEAAADPTPAADDTPVPDSPANTSPAEPPPSAARRLRATLAAGWAAVRDRLPGTARPARPQLDRAFDEDFIAPLRPARIARFALRQGTARRPGPDSWPQRLVQAKAGTDANRTELLYLRTAAIEVGKQRRRLLIGAGLKGRVLGTRIWSRPRIAVAAGLCVIGLGSPLAWQLSDRLGGHEPLLAAAQTLAPGAAAARSAASGVLANASSASSATAPEAAASAGAEPSANAATSPSAQAAVAQGPSASHPAAAGSATIDPVSATAQAAPTASVPTHGHTTTATAPSATPPAAGSASGATTVAQGDSAASGDANKQGIRPNLSTEAREAAKRESQALRTAKAASAAGPGGSASDAGAGDGKVYAVATPATRTRAGAQLRIVLMNAPTDAEAGQPRAEVLQVGDGWRAVIWPYNDRASAERTREQLASRGIPAEVIGF